MGLLDYYKKAKSYLAKEVRVFNAGDLAPLDTLPFLPSWFQSAQLGMPRQINISELRMFAKSSWFQMVSNAILKQIMITDWRMVVREDNNSVDIIDPKHEEMMKEVKKLLMKPNRNGDAFWDIWIPFLRDVMEIDAGVVFKGKNIAGKLSELFAYDGGKFLININEHGIIGRDSENVEGPGYYQYSFRAPNSAPVPFEKDDIVYGRINTSTENYPYGFAPLQSIQQILQIMIESDRQNKEFFENNSIPDGLININMEREQLKMFQAEWHQQMKGQAHKLAFVNNDVNFTPFNMSKKDMEWLEGQKWYFHLVFGAFGLSPQEVGFYENSNKSTGESQERITIKNAIKPYLELIASKINREIIPDLIGSDEVDRTS